MISVILCGGAGARLWPVSRELHPKPFLRLKDGQSLIQKAFLRGAAAPEANSIMTVTNRNLYFKVAEEYAATGLQLDVSYVLEPLGRNTAPAITIAALRVKQLYGEDEPVMVLPADHIISNSELFFKSVSRALALVKEGRLVIFGITPTRPEAGFGYFEVDGERVVRFVEKPTLARAIEYIESKHFLWNSGIICFKAGVMLAELSRYDPELLVAAEACFAASTDGVGAPATHDADHRLQLEDESFARIPSISIDYSVLEKSNNVAAVYGEDFGWNDIGSWTELCGFEEADADGNRISEPTDAILHDCRDCDINNHGRLVAALGVNSLLIVDTPDALLVADKSRAQDVNIIYNRLKDTNCELYKHHRTIYRPWGSFTLLEGGARFKIKRLVIKPNAAISLQRHHNRSEHWIVVSGMAEVTCDDRIFFLSSNESTYIKAGSKHRVGNPGKIELVLIEVQSGDYLGEDDIARFDDMYGRAEAPNSGSTDAQGKRRE